MDKYDELLARLDNLIRTHEGKLIDCHDAAAAIRELEAKLEAVEQRLREIEAHADALARALDGMSYDANIALPQAFHDYRALAPERTVTDKEDRYEIPAFLRKGA